MAGNGSKTDLPDCCASCRFVRVDAKGGKLECHAHPPAPTIVPSQLVGGLAGSVSSVSSHPPVDPMDWCGEYDRDTARRAERMENGKIRITSPQLDRPLVAIHGGSA
jgi:hypothetical protein